MEVYAKEFMHWCGSTQSLPCVRGGGTAKAVTEGLCSRILRIHIRYRRIRTTSCDNPSVKNQRFLTAPFTQGSLWALPRQRVKSGHKQLLAAAQENVVYFGQDNGGLGFQLVAG